MCVASWLNSRVNKMNDGIKKMMVVGGVFCVMMLQGCDAGGGGEQAKRPRFLGHGHAVEGRHEEAEHQEVKHQGAEAAQKKRIEHVGNMDYPALSEVSGIVCERAANGDAVGRWWVMNDSGNDAVVFAVDEKGQLVREIKVEGAKNFDWEDVAIDGGRLYISDLGNNGNGRKDLGVYAVDGVLGDQGEPLEVVWYGMCYEDQETYPAEVMEYDCESIFFLDGKFAVLTKHRKPNWEPNPGTKLYVLDELNAGEGNVLRKVDERGDVGLWVTAADMSPSGDRLAVLGMTELWVFDRPEDGSDRWLSEGACWRMVFPDGMLKQAEGVCWDDEQTIRIANEQRELYVLDASLLERYVSDEE